MSSQVLVCFWKDSDPAFHQSQGSWSFRAHVQVCSANTTPTKPTPLLQALLKPLAGSVFLASAFGTEPIVLILTSILEPDTLKETGICHPKICLFGIKIIIFP